MNPDTLAILRKMILAKFDVQEDGLDNDRPFTELGLDSLDLADFMFQVEDRFNVEVDYETAMKEPTLNGLARLVDRLQVAAAETVPAA